MINDCIKACAEKTHLIYFSPTGTTRRVVEQVAVGLGMPVASHYDLTRQFADIGARLTDGLAIIGVPVYAGRVPEVCLQRFQGFSAVDVPAIIVALYGNREFEDALVELRDLVSSKGFRVIAAGAFIGEHSYSTPQQPIAANRPDVADLRQALEFGEESVRRLREGTVATPNIPGNLPYRERPPLGGIAPETDQQHCTLCGVCANVCPTAVISVQDKVITDAAHCTICCACTRICPVEARYLNHPMVKARREMLVQHYSARKEPSLFL